MCKDKENKIPTVMNNIFKNYQKKTVNLHLQSLCVKR